MTYHDPYDEKEAAIQRELTAEEDLKYIRRMEKERDAALARERDLRAAVERALVDANMDHLTLALAIRAALDAHPKPDAAPLCGEALFSGLPCTRETGHDGHHYRAADPWAERYPAPTPPAHPPLSGCDWDEGYAAGFDAGQAAGHTLTVTREPEFITVPRPHVPHGPEGVPAAQADADYLRSAARNFRYRKVCGSNLTETVCRLLTDAADALGVTVVDAPEVDRD